MISYTDSNIFYEGLGDSPIKSGIPPNSREFKPVDRTANTVPSCREGK